MLATILMAHCAVQWPNVRFIGFESNSWLHDGDRMIAFIGGAQIDAYGNVNSTLHWRLQSSKDKIYR